MVRRSADGLIFEQGCAVFFVSPGRRSRSRSVLLPYGGSALDDMAVLGLVLQRRQRRDLRVVVRWPVAQKMVNIAREDAVIDVANVSLG